MYFLKKLLFNISLSSSSSPRPWFQKLFFAVILDTFAELRDQKQKIEEDIATKCFICGIDSYTFDRYGNGFQNHIKNDHNMWKYLFFVAHLLIKDRTNYTGQESYVYEKLKVRDLSFYPVNKALILQNLQEQEDKENEIKNKLFDLSRKVDSLTDSLQKMADSIHTLVTASNNNNAGHEPHAPISGKFSRTQAKVVFY